MKQNPEDDNHLFRVLLLRFYPLYQEIQLIIYQRRVREQRQEWAQY